MGRRRAGAAEDDEQSVQLPQPLLSGWPVHNRGADGAGDGGQPPDRRLLRRPPAGSTSARARCPPSMSSTLTPRTPPSPPRPPLLPPQTTALSTGRTWRA